MKPLGRPEEVETKPGAGSGGGGDMKADSGLEAVVGEDSEVEEDDTGETGFLRDPVLEADTAVEVANGEFQDSSTPTS